VLDYLESQDHQCCKRMSELRLLLQEHHKLVFYNLDPTVITVKENIFYRPILQSNEAQSKKLKLPQYARLLQSLVAIFCLCSLFSTYHKIIKVNTTNESTGESHKVFHQFQNNTCPIIN
jgi:hypothetical protein